MLAGGSFLNPQNPQVDVFQKTEVRLTQKVGPCCTHLPDPRERYKSKSETADVENKISHTGKGLSTIPLFQSFLAALEPTLFL